MLSKFLRHISLQTRLLLVLLLVVVAGLTLSSLAVTTIMRGVLYERVDQELKSSLDGWTRNPDMYVGENYGPPSDFAVLRIGPNGNWQWINAGQSKPDLGRVQIDGRPTTVESLPGSEDQYEWRAIAVRTPTEIIAVAKSLEHERIMISWLIFVQASISFLVLIFVGFVGNVMIRRALRPLASVEYTALAVADGDLDRRVPVHYTADTEVGRLSRATNKMIEQLQQSLETAQHKEEQMRRFIGDASHELRTPLTSVRGYTELYRSGATDDVDKVLDKIDEESGRMKLLVEDLLALTRAEGSRLNRKPTDVLEVAISAVASARAAFPDREIHVDNRTDSLPLVNGDGDRLHQVFLNLITNGLRHGGPDADVNVKISNDNRDVIVEIIDNGVGMSPEVKEHIFERFYRADSSRSRGSGGSGLGLAIVTGIVEQHGGTVVVESTEGVGSTFRVRIPRLINPPSAA